MVTFTCAGQQLVLNSPRLNDTESLVLPAAIDHAMDGSIYIFAKLGKPQNKLSMFFEHLNRPKVLEVIDFLKVAMGQLVTYIDYNGVVWKGKFLMSPFETTHVDVRNNQFNVEFEITNA